MTIHSPVTELGRVLPKQTKALKSLGIVSIQDLLLYFPRRHIDFSTFSNIKELKADTTVTVTGTVKSIQKRFSFKTHKSLAEAVVSDETGSVQVTWFNQAYIASMYKPGDRIALAGKVTLYKGLQLLNPVHEKLSAENIHTGRLVPIYRLPEALYDRTFRNLIQKALPFSATIPDTIPYFLQQKYNLFPLEETIREMHFPTSEYKLQQAKERLVFEEVLIQQLATLLHKQQLEKLPAYNIKQNKKIVAGYLKNLPFKLTQGQSLSIDSILGDMEVKHPMNRLLEGDVGSGKTLVAFVSMLETARAGLQTLLLAPTEVLAKQHYETLQKFLSVVTEEPVQTALFSRNFAIIDGVETTQKILKERITSGEVKIVIATHAALQDAKLFKNLALLVVDEQHRFGVEQRSVLLKPKNKTTPVPHLLSMSATPIPRTLALTLYSSLEISRLDELPGGRHPIQTFLVPEQKRPAAYDFIKKEIRAGRQCFIVTPLVEESEKLQVKSVKTEFEKLQKEIFRTQKVGLVYGGMKGAEKDEAMTDFATGKIDILVATSVVEVGVDIPNASVMVIEGAERFGLAQLHQLRGRVGRGQHKSYCMLFLSNEAQNATERLTKFTRIDNGFELAEIDLENRGFGNLFGINQSGFHFKYGEYLTIQTLKIAKTAAEELLQEGNLAINYPGLHSLAQPLVKDIHLE